MPALSACLFKDHLGRPLGEHDPNRRVVCIGELRFHAKGLLVSVTITKGGVPPVPLP